MNVHRTESLEAPALVERFSIKQRGKEVAAWSSSSLFAAHSLCDVWPLMLFAIFSEIAGGVAYDVDRRVAH